MESQHQLLAFSINRNRLQIETYAVHNGRYQCEKWVMGKEHVIDKTIFVDRIFC